MVFESIIVDLLNRFLGEYVENLDRSQLKLGIWGGDVVLQDLILKESALDEFDLPIKTVAGRLGKLVLKIPWKNLYTAPVIATIEGLIILAVPNQSIKYNAEKEEKSQQESKQKELQRIEEAKQKEADKGQDKKENDTFAEKLATQVVKNVQITIRDIHIRYEDQYTCPQNPFALGVTLHSLAVQTTDENWKPCIIQDVVQMIHKLLTLDSLALYWNSRTELYCQMDDETRLKKFKDGIASQGCVPQNMSYILGPINSTAQLQLNPKPEQDGSNYTIPKVLSNIVMEELAVGLSKFQYQDLLELLQSFERMSIGNAYRKYRPEVMAYSRHAKEWWHFAFNCVLEEDVRRRHRNWSWEHIKQHRFLCSKYREAYKTKLSSKKISADTVRLLSDSEEQLDVFNITLIRKQVELEVERIHKEVKAQQSRWFGGWWGKKKANEQVKEDGTGNEIAKKFEEAMTGDEKNKLYEAIGYQENSTPAFYPTTFVEIKVIFLLRDLSITVRDEEKEEQLVLHMNLSDVWMTLQQRPSAEAMKLESTIGSLVIKGSVQDGSTPDIVTSQMISKEIPLLDLLFEINPIDGLCDQRVHVSSRPLEVHYDALSMNQLVDVFKPQEDVALSQLQATAVSKLEEFKEKSTMGLQYAIEHHKVLDVNIDLSASYIILPEKGIYASDVPMIVVDLGSIKMSSVQKHASVPNVARLAKAGTSEEAILEEMKLHSYDRFKILIQNIQVIVVLPGEDWKSVTDAENSPLHLIPPMSFDADFQKCLILDDPRLPKLKLGVSLSVLNINISDFRLLQLFKILMSIPFPEDKSMDTKPPKVQELDTKVQATASESTALHLIEKTELKTAEPEDTESLVQLTDLVFKFEIQDMSLNLVQHRTDRDIHLVKFTISSFETAVSVRTFDMSVDLLLGNITVQHPEFHMPTGGQVYLISTPTVKGRDLYLFTLRYTNVQPKSPEFHTKHKSTLQQVKINFSSVDVILHQEAIFSVMKFTNDIIEEVENLQKKKNASQTIEQESEKKTDDEKKLGVAQQTTKKVKAGKEEDIDMNFEAHLEAVTVQITTSESAMALVSVKGLETCVVVQKSLTTVTAGVKDIIVQDAAEDTHHQQILSIVGSDAFDAKIIIFNDATENENYVNMQAVDTSVSLTIGQMKVVFLNRFVTSLLGFIDQFQTAKAALVEASAAAAEAARHNMEEAYAKAARVALDIIIKAPVIIIPQHSKSSSALVADLGFLTLKNKFNLGTVRNELGLPAIFDKICLELKNLKFSRTLLDLKTGEVTAECLLLEPLSFSLDITRNLAVNWYREVAEVDVSGKLVAIKMSFSQEDYEMMLQTLTENLQEGQKAKTPTKQGLRTVVSTEGHKDTATDVHKSQTELDVILPQTIYKRVKLSFTLESLQVELYSGSSDLTKELAVRDSSKGLAKFSLNVIAMKGEVLSDNSVWTTVVLVNCLLDDTRCGRQNGIFRLMKRKENICSKGMVDITFHQEASQDRFVEIKVFSFDLVLCVEYLMKVASFFTVESSQSQCDNAVTPKEGPRTMQAEPETAAVAKMTLHLKVEQPNIILVEDMEDINTNAIVLNNEIQMKLWITPEQMSIMGCISNLQILSCCYNPTRRADTMAEILSPCCITVTAVNPQFGGMRIDVNASEILLGVSPGTIEMLTKISSSFSMPEVTSAEDEKSEKQLNDVWATKNLSQFDFWFLKTEMGKEVFEEVVLSPDPSFQVYKGDQLLLTTNSVIITLEAGIGNNTIPLIMLQSSFDAEVRDWNSQLLITCGLTLEMSYFNSKLALWEPLIEPVEAAQEGQLIHRPWELTVQLRKNENIAPTSPDVEIDIETLSSIPPTITINFDSRDTLEVTITKTSLDVLSSLGDAFSEAVYQTLQKKDLPAAPYIVKNETGLAVTLLLSGSPFQVYGCDDSDEIKEVVLEIGTEIQLLMQEKEEGTRFSRRISTLREQDDVVERNLTIKVNQMNYVHQIPVAKADKRYFPLPQRTEKGDQWGLVTDIQVHHSCKIVTLRSPLTVYNHFDNAIDVYYMTKRGNEVAFVGTVDAGSHFNVPMHAVYTPTNELFFSVKGFTVSIIPFIWKDLQKNFSLKMLLQCNSRNQENGEPFFINAFGELEHVCFQDTRRKTMASTCYNIYLHPTVVLRNLLPIPICYTLPGMLEDHHIKDGGTVQLVTTELGSSSIVLKIHDYLEKEWTCKKDLEVTPPELSIWTFESFDGAVKVTLELGMHTAATQGTQTMSLYCPFWMINKTGFMLTYKGDEPSNILYHPEDVEGPILFSFKPKSFFSKKKAVIKVEDSEWSDKFSLDVVGSSGTVICKSSNVTYQVGVHIRLSHSSLTKHVIFTPYYILISNSSYDIQCREMQENAEWITIPAGSCMAFWPQSNKKELVARVAGTTEGTPVFPIDTVHTTLLKLENKYAGINTECQISESEVLLTFDEYHDGNATVQMVNHGMDFTIDFWEKGVSDKKKLAPQEVIFYTWEKPTGQRKLCWSCGKSEHCDNLQKDDIGDFSPNSDDRKIVWVSFLDGMQRVLLFTDDIDLACTLAQGSGDMERIEQEINISIHGVGLSLVNNARKTELLYLGIRSSGIVWEGKKSGGKRYKVLSVKECKLIEDAYQKYQAQMKTTQHPNPQQILEGNIEVDFSLLTMTKPNKRRLKRVFQTGLWFQYRASAHQKQVHAKINRLQIDSQLEDCVFPTVLAPVPPPKSVVAESIPKPFAELSIMQHTGEHSSVQQFKYFKILVQEFHVQVDQGIIIALLDLFQADELKEKDDNKLFAKDLMLVKQELKMHATLQSSQEQKNFYDYLHFSPLKIHVSFSLTGTSGNGSQQPAQIHSSFINLLLQTVGVTLTEIQDVVFRLAYFERQHKFLSQPQILQELQVHYTSQAIKQLYVLVLGLDVIGNPFGLVLGLSKGVEDLFYEPFQGAIQGPGEFAEGLALGVRSLFGHAVGGAAGAVSRITGTIGKGIAALSLDDDFQKKRREAMSRRPADLREGLAQSGKGLVMGVVDGVSGVIMKPIKGAKEQGVEGFFKGMGKGVVGLVTRPTVGVIDFASGTFESVKRITDMTDDIAHLRPPRYFHMDGLVRPYIRQEAEGNRLLKGLEKGKFATTDLYIAHLVVSEDGKVVLLVTDKRLIYLSRNDIIGQWQVDWQCTWSDIANTEVTKKGLHIIMKETKKKVFGLFGSGDAGRLVPVTSPERCTWIIQKIEEAQKQ